MNLIVPSEKKTLSFLRAWYLVGILGFAVPWSYEVFRHLIPLNILLTTALILVYHRPVNYKFLVATVSIFLLGWGVEVAGVKTGVLFGQYGYGTILGPKIAEVPIIMGLNWILMVYGGLAITSRTGWGIIPVSLLNALLLTVSDFIIEKYAILTEIWIWEGGDPPLRNFIGWFVSSFIFSLIYYHSVRSQPRKIALAIYIYQLVLFILTYLIVTFIWQ